MKRVDVFAVRGERVLRGGEEEGKLVELEVGGGVVVWDGAFGGHGGRWGEVG